jgi:ribonuclease D
VHAGQQDVEPVIRHTGKEPANLFDTQIAAGFVGITYPVSLSKLVFECVGAKLGKGLTFTHWDQRPLSAMQLRYAADDVRYLPALRAELGRRLEAVGHAGYAREECDRMCDASLYRFDPETQYLRVRGAGSLQGHQLAVLKELVVWRDTAARAHDVPPRAFVRDEVLVDLSRSPAKTVEKLAKVKGLPRPVEAAHGTEIVEATLRALATPVTHQPAQRAADESPAEKFRADAIWAVAQCICLGQGIDPALATSRSDLAEFYRAAVADALPEDHALLQGWRKRLLADPLLEFMRSQSPLTLEWTNRSLQIRD